MPAPPNIRRSLVPQRLVPRRIQVALSRVALVAIPLVMPLAAQDLGPLGERPFSHATHVDPTWFAFSGSQFTYSEVSADCWTCHDPDKPTEIKDGVCTPCHFGLFQQRGSRPAAPEKLFVHQEHVNALNCRFCHSLRDMDGRIRRGSAAPPNMPVVEGVRSCLACHGEQAEALVDEVIAPTPRVKAALLAEAAPRLRTVIQRLNQDDIEEIGPHRYTAEKPGFLHGDHIAGWPNSKVAKDCVACHANVADAVSECEVIGNPDLAGAVLGRNIFGSAACGTTCHIQDAQKTPIEFTTGTRAWKSFTAGTFSHKDHLGNADPKDLPELVDGRAALAQESCFLCHSLDDPSAPRSYVTNTEFLRDDGVMTAYNACEKCHASWQVKDGRQTANSNELPHAQIRKNMNLCDPCHKLGFVTDMKAIPYEVEVERLRRPVFAITSHAHPFITGGAKNDDGSSKVAESCADCHKAEISEQPSRIRKKQFSHATHLPREATAADCQACHPAIGETSGPGEIDTAEAPLFDANACAKCHVGVVMPDVADQRVKVKAPVFPHKAHIGKTLPDGKTLDCVSCHNGKVPDGTPVVGVLDSAKNCTQCHNHGELAAVTGKVSDAYVSNCLNCHKRGVPATGEELPAQERQFIAGTTTRQFHPPSEGAGSAPCKECHEAQIGNPTVVRTPEADLVFGIGAFQVTSGPGFHAGADDLAKQTRGIEPRSSNSNCICCHWAEQIERATRPWPSTAIQDARELRVWMDMNYGQRKYPGLNCCETK